MARCLRLVLFGVALCGAGGAMVWGQAHGPDFGHAGSRRGSTRLRVHNTSVTINVPYSAFDRTTGIAVVTVTRAVQAEVHASRSWTLRVRSDRAQLSNNYGNNDKPCSDLAIRATGQPGFQPLSTSPTPVLSGNKTHGWDDIAFDLRFTASLTDAPGSYTLNLLFDFN